MVVDRLNRLGISECEGNLNLLCAVRHHIGGEPMAKPCNLREKTAVIGIDLQRVDSDTVNEIRRVRLGNYFAKRFLGTFENRQLHTVTSAERDNSFIASLRCRHFGHYFPASSRLNQRFSSHALENTLTCPWVGSALGAPRWQAAISGRG